MITVRTACLNKEEVNEMYNVLMAGLNRLCKDGGENCAICSYKKLCINLVSAIEYIKTAPPGR